jgi:hypothetical protein
VFDPFRREFMIDKEIWGSDDIVRWRPCILISFEEYGISSCFLCKDSSHKCLFEYHLSTHRLKTGKVQVRDIQYNSFHNMFKSLNSMQELIVVKLHMVVVAHPCRACRDLRTSRHQHHLSSCKAQTEGATGA